MTVSSEPATDWDRFFSGRTIPAEEVRSLVRDLSEKRRHEDVIACLEAAVRAGQIQPWMYEVLALSMQIVGRPPADVERVLLSSQDVVAQDVDSLLFLGSHLVRLGRDEQAVAVYRQASRLQPTRYEPYELALQPSARTQKPDLLAWSAAGLARYDWSSRRDERLRTTQLLVTGMVGRLAAMGDPLNATRLEQTFRQALARDVAVRLEWSGHGDLDLEIHEPGGTVCSVNEPHTLGGGVFLHDGFGPRPDNCFEHYVCPLAFPGEYRVVIRHAYGEIVGNRARLVITRDAGTPQERKTQFQIRLGPEPSEVRFALPGGRREQPGEAGGRETSDRSQRGSAAMVSRQLHAAARIQSQTSAGGVTPAVGGGAVGYQPVIQFLTDGITLTATAAVSADRRYVRINARPVFSAVTDLFTFSFVQ